MSTTAAATVQSESAALRYGLVSLTPRERQIFDCLHAALGRWLDPRTEVELVVFGPYYDPRTFRTHVWHLGRKLAGTPWRIERAYRAIRLITVA